MSPGDIITGTMSFIKKNEASTLGVADKPGGYAVKYVCGPNKAPPPSTAVSAASANPTKSVESDSAIPGMQAVLKEAKIKHIKSLINTSTVAFSEIFNQLVDEYPDEINLHVCSLQHYEAKAKEYYSYDNPADINEETKEHVQALFALVVTNANKVISLLNPTELAAALGVLTDKDDPKSVSSKKDAEGKKTILVDALYSKIIATLHVSRLLNEPTVELENLCKEIAKWENINTSEKFWRISVERFKKANKYYERMCCTAYFSNVFIGLA